MKLFYNIEHCVLADDLVQLQGWVMGDGAVEISVLDDKGKEMECGISRAYRQDVLLEYDVTPIGDQKEGVPDGTDAGFQIKFPANAT